MRRSDRHDGAAHAGRHSALRSALCGVALVAAAPFADLSTEEHGPPLAWCSLVSAAEQLPGVSAVEDTLRRRLDAAEHSLTQGNFAEVESEARAILSLLDFEHRSETLDYAETIDLLVEAAARSAGTPQTDVRPMAERAVALKETLLGPEHLETAKSLDNLGRLLRILGAHREAVPHAVRALDIRQRELPPDHPLLLSSLQSVGALAWDAGDYRKCVSYFLRVLEIQEEEYGREHEKCIRSRAFLADAYRLAGDHAEARRLCEQVLEVRERTLGPNHLDVASSANLLGLILRATGDYPEARQSLERAIRIREQQLGGDHLHVAHSLNNLALVLHSMAEYRGACAMYERALDILERNLGDEHHVFGACLTNLAITRIELGEFSVANRINERALRIVQTARGPDHPDVATTLTSLGVGLQRAGDFDRAKEVLEQAVRIRERALGEDNVELATSLGNLAIVLRRVGDHDAALMLSRRVLEIRERALGDSHPDVALALGNLSTDLWSVGATGEAVAARQRSLSILERVLPPDHPDRAACLLGLAGQLRDLGRAAEARSSAERSLAIYEAAYGSDHPAVARAHVTLAELLLDQGESQQALEHALAAEDVGRWHLRLSGSVSSASQAERYAISRPSGLAVALEVANREGHAVDLDRIWDAQVGSRAVLLDQLAWRHHLVLRSDEQGVDSLRSIVVDARAALAHLLVRGPGGDGLAVYRKVVQQSERELDAAEAVLAERSSTFASELDRAGIGLREVLASLPAASALIAFSRWDPPRSTGRNDGSGEVGSAVLSSGPSGAGPHPVAQPKPHGRYLAFVTATTDDPSSFARVRPIENRVSVVPLGPVDRIDSLITCWRATAAGDASHSGDPYSSIATRLRELVWDPIAPLVEGCDLALIVPDGELALLNFGSLVLDDDSYLIEHPPTIQYLATERDVVEGADPSRSLGESVDRAQPSSRPHAGSGLLAVGDPDFDRGTTAARQRSESQVTGAYRGALSLCQEFASIRFSRLPATGEEVRSITTLWSTRAQASDGDGVLSLTGGVATEEAMKLSCAGKRVVHLATHGFFLGQDCPSVLSSATRGLGAPLRVDDPPPIPTGENPLLLSGLALAGANLRNEAPPDGEDGILTAEEIASLDLTGCEWAVLSACGTGLGETRSSEGVFGLRRAFATAGAKTVIMSLWDVEDEATAEWMERLYRARLERGLTTAESVREASLGMLRDRRAKGLSTHPAYWGAFIAAGDWR